jgi:hypothetical protein
VQAAQLQHDQEQEEDDGAAGVLEVLPLLPQAHGASGEQVRLQIADFRLIADCRLTVALIDDHRRQSAIFSEIRNLKSEISGFDVGQ